MGSARRAQNFGGSKEESNKPGPGMYEGKSSLDGPSFVFGKEGESKIGTLSPGPGAYDAKDGVMRDSSRSAKIGTAHRGSANNSMTRSQEIPGPGMYDPKLEDAHSFKFDKS